MQLRSQFEVIYLYQHIKNEYPLMPRQLDAILVVDVESTCWEGSPPPGQMSEIIEIGVATIDVATLERVEKRSILVKPQRSEVSAFCTSLTTLTADDLRDAGTLAEAVDLLASQYKSRQRLWGSWGDYDRNQFQTVCDAFGAPYPLSPTHLNIKTLFAAAHGLKREVGMSRALEIAKRPLEGTHHRGDDDAWNIAELLCDMLQAMRGGK